MALAKSAKTAVKHRWTEEETFATFPTSNEGHQTAAWKEVDGYEAILAPFRTRYKFQ